MECDYRSDGGSIEGVEGAGDKAVVGLSVRSGAASKAEVCCGANAAASGRATHGGTPI